MNRHDIVHSITKYGGFKYFRKLLGYKLLKKPGGYWTEKTIITELESIIEELSYFPTKIELEKIGRCDLSNAISLNGGINHFRKLFKFELLRKPKGYWNEENTIIELEAMIEKLGYFPSQRTLNKMNRSDLSFAIKKHGGFNHLRKRMNYNIIQKSSGYWTEEVIITELELIIMKLGFYPSDGDLNKINKKYLESQIYRHGGTNYFRNKLGYPLSFHEEYMSELMSYVGKRGRKSEQVIEEIITKWCLSHSLPKPDFNVKLAPGNVLEFICDFDKKVGIDVTNTKASKNAAINTINKKWRHKQYRFHLDELWIVVFTDILLPEDYIKLNMKSPENVKVFSIDAFLRELDYSIEYCDMNKIDNLKNCSFHNKEEMKGINKTLGEVYV